eukprot:TRINITY_DN9642_c0_g1_i1.p1 TRINITY_DN9642_c0_g1~~TRINITY_DN9642_c0_g1_i1.p1  ORF type:complete len:358 (+),score=34.25 TRINITY_DN9642_c0_g1_i1:260-1333(+)
MTYEAFVRFLLVAVLLLILPLLVQMVVYGPVDDIGGGRAGVWGPRTASVNWCEADYAVTPYLAEFGNSLSSLVIAVYGIVGLLTHSPPQYLRWLPGMGTRAAHTRHHDLELRYILSFVVFVVVGTGSFLFHATLWRSMQLLDELPMVWGNGIFVYVLRAMEDPKRRGPRPSEAAVIVAALCVMSVAVWWLDEKSQDVFLVCYGVPLIYIILRTFALCRKHIHITAAQQESGGGSPATAHAHRWGTARDGGGPLRSCHTALFESATACYGLGFVLWMFDRMYCGGGAMGFTALGLYATVPAGWVRGLHLHSWWHVLAGTGTFQAVILWLWLRHRSLGRHARVVGVPPCVLRVVWDPPA